MQQIIQIRRLRTLYPNELSRSEWFLLCLWVFEAPKLHLIGCSHFAAEELISLCLPNYPWEFGTSVHSKHTWRWSVPWSYSKHVFKRGVRPMRVSVVLELRTSVAGEVYLLILTLQRSYHFMFDLSLSCSQFDITLFTWPNWSKSCTA